MLEVYIEKEFFEKYHLAFENRDDLRYDFQFNFLRKLRNCTLFTNYSNFKVLADDITKNPLLELMIETVPKVEYDQSLSKTISNIEFLKSGSPFKIILSYQSDEICIEYRKKFGLEYLNPTNLTERWSIYSSGRDDSILRTTFDPLIPSDCRFDSWEKFAPFIHPLNAVFILDLYLFSWESDWQLKNSLDNLFPLLSHLLAEASTEVSVDITIMSKFCEKDQEYKMKTTFDKIFEFLKKFPNNSKFKLGFIDYQRVNLYSDDQYMHQRYIITNGFFIEAGAGFTIFSKKKIEEKRKPQPYIHHDSHIQFVSQFSKRQHLISLSYLHKIEQYVSELEERDKSTNKLNYYKSKTNRLLQN